MKTFFGRGASFRVLFNFDKSESLLVDSILACTYKSVHGNWKEQSLANCVDYPATNFPVLSYLLD